MDRYWFTLTDDSVIGRNSGGAFFEHESDNDSDNDSDGVNDNDSDNDGDTLYRLSDKLVGYSESDPNCGKLC